MAGAGGKDMNPNSIWNAVETSKVDLENIDSLFVV